MVMGGRTPVLAAERLDALGFNIAIYPGLGLSCAAEALRQAYGHLRQSGSSLGLPVPGYQGQSLHELMGFPEVWAFEEKWSREG